MRSKREITGFEEGTHQLRSHADTLCRLPEMDLELADMVGCLVGQLDLLQVPPDPLVGVEFRCVRREKFQTQAVPVGMHEMPDRRGLVRLDVVPEHDDTTAHVAQQVPQEHEHLGGSDRATADQHVQLASGADAGDRRELGPGVPVRHDRGLPDGRPGADPGGNQAETGLIGKDQCGLLPADFFLIRGHSWCRQRWTSRSSRSRARLVGLWYDQPHCRRSFGKWCT